MNEGVSDDESLDFEDKSSANQHWPANNSSERIRRSCASTDIAALMDTPMEEDTGREEVEDEEHHSEELPQRWLEFYRDRFQQATMKWTPPASIDDRFRELLNVAVRLCEQGRCDGTMEMFVNEVLYPLFKKWYYSGDGVDHWQEDVFTDIGETVFRVVRMFRGLIVAGVGSRDIPAAMWEIMFFAMIEQRTNMFLGDKLYAMPRLEYDESADVDLIKPEHQNQPLAIAKYLRCVILHFDAIGFEALQKFFNDNVTASTSIDDLIRYLRTFKFLVILLKPTISYATFASLVYTCSERVLQAPEEQRDCKNLRGPIDQHPLFALHGILGGYAQHVPDFSQLFMQLIRWRLTFCLKALNEAPFNGRMSAVECLQHLVHELQTLMSQGATNLEQLMKWMEEERTVDMLTRDNLHNASYVDRVLRVFEVMLRAEIFTTADLSTVWEAQRGKHDAIQRNLADLIIRIVPHFDNDLMEALFFKIQAGWVDGGVKERETLIDIVRKIGENSAQAHAQRHHHQARDNDTALIDSSLQTLWKFIRNPGPRETEEAALQAHLKLLEDSRILEGRGYMKSYAELCSADIQQETEMSATAASHLVHILELVSDDEEDDEDEFPTSVGRQEMITSLDHSHRLVHSLCANIAKTVRTVETKNRRESLFSFLQALSFVLNQDKQQLTLSPEHASALWKALVQNPVHDYDTKFGFKFFMEIVDDVMDRGLLMSFFTEYVMQCPPERVSHDGYMCFQAFFKVVNDLHGGRSSAVSQMGLSYVRDLVLRGANEVCERASNLWSEYLQKMIELSNSALTTSHLVQQLVSLITDQHATMGQAVAEAAARGMPPTNNPAYDMAKDRTQRCIKMLTLLVSNMDEEVCVARRSEPSLAQAAVGRPLSVCSKVTRREWDSVGYGFRGSTRADELDLTLDMHENTTVMELRDIIKFELARRLANDRPARRKGDIEELMEHFLVVYVPPEGPRTLRFSDYKRTLGDVGMTDVAEVEIRFDRKEANGVNRLGDGSPESSTSESDWMTPEDIAEDRMREAILPSRALAESEEMVDRLLEVAESGDVDIAMGAFRLLMMVPQNNAKLAALYEAMATEDALRSLLAESSASRYLYYLLMLEAIVLPADPKTAQGYRGREPVELAIYAMNMFLRVLPHVGTLPQLMERAAAFRSLAVISITHILQVICLTAARIVAKAANQQLESAILSLLRLNQVEIPPKSSKFIRVRRASSMYADALRDQERQELMRLMQANSAQLLQTLCGVILAASAFESTCPLARDCAAILASTTLHTREPLFDETVMMEEREEFGGCAMIVPALMECAVYAIAMLAAAVPRQTAQFIGASVAEPSPLWVHTLVAATFHKADNVRLLSWSLFISIVEVVRDLVACDDRKPSAELDLSQVSLTSALLDLLPRAEGKERYAEQFVALVKECVKRSHSWEAKIVRLYEHIHQGVDFLNSALLHSTAQQTPFQDEMYLRARIEVLQMLMRYTAPEERSALGSAAEGPRLCERLLSDFIFPAPRTSEAAAVAAAATAAASSSSNCAVAGAAAGDAMVVETDSSLPRSVTHAEMNSCSSLFDLQAASGALPRSVSALPAPSTRRVAVCSGEGSQNGALQLLLSLCDAVPENQILMQTTFYRLFYSNPWTDKKDFEYMPQHILRGEGDLVGLKNGGATCYMNSIFQQLFMIDEVREAVLNVTIPEKVLLERRASDSSSAAGGSSGDVVIGQHVIKAQQQQQEQQPNRGDYAVKVLAAVQSLFAHLLGSELESYRPTEFWKVFAFKPNGESVNVREQQDAVEFHNMVTELIDEGLRACQSEAACERTFRGHFADEKICKDCPHRYTKEEPFESLSLDVRSHNNLRDSLKEYVKGDVLENDNAYHCELCNKKVKAIKRLSLSKLPEVLIVQLKRFDFDWEKEISVKFNDYFEFPFEIDMQPYTVEGLEKLEKDQPLESCRDYQYMLRGVVVHSGQAQGGHYTSYIRNRETGRWFKFDDNDVTPWEATENGAQQRWFGCSDSGMDSMGRGNKRKIRTTYWNAYMLFYEKLETANRYLSSANPSSVASDMSTSSGVSSMTTTMTAIVSSASTGGNCSPSCISPTPSSSGTVTAAASSSTATTTTATAGAVSPVLRGAMEGPMKVARAGASASPVSNLHRHFSTLSLSSARIRMPPLLEEMLREGNRRVQLERVQYSTHYFAFVTAATGKALATAALHPAAADELLMATMHSFASFIVHNGLFASRELLSSNESLAKCSFKTWQSHMQQLLAFPAPRTWFITNVLFSHEIAACFLFASDVSVRGFFQSLIVETMVRAEADGDASETCLRPDVTSPLAGQLAKSLRDFPRMSHLLVHLLGALPFKHTQAVRNEPINFYRTIVELAGLKGDKQPNMVVPLVRGGVLNVLLGLFSPLSSDLASLNRRDARVYEEVHMVVANLLRTIRMETSKTEGAALGPNQWCTDSPVIRRSELPDQKVLLEFLRPEGGHVKFLHHLVELMRRATRNSAGLSWAMHGVLWVLWDHPTASAVVMDSVCQYLSLKGIMISEMATDWLVGLLRNLFSLKDNRAEQRFEHLFYKVQLTSVHANPSVQGLLEYERISESRQEALLRVLLAAVECMPDVEALIRGDERVFRLLVAFNDFTITRATMSKHAQTSVLSEYHEWYTKHADELTNAAIAAREAAAAAAAAAAARMESEADASTSDSTMTELTSSSERPASQNPYPFHQNHEHLNQSSSVYSAGQLSPSSRLGLLTLSGAGEKRPLPPMEEGEEADAYSADRKRSVGETMMRALVGTAATSSGASTSNTNSYVISPPAPASPPLIEEWTDGNAMDDRELLISSSSSSTNNRAPSVPPPAYSATISSPPPPPIPPRPSRAQQMGEQIIAAAAHKQPSTGDEFVVEKRKDE